MFKFNFSTASGDDEPAAVAQQAPAAAPVTASSAEAAAAEEVFLDEARHVGLHDVVHVAEGVQLLKAQVSTTQAASLLGKEELAGSDLLPGQYEGGFKVWEGSVDLAQYVAELWRGVGKAAGRVSPAEVGRQQQLQHQQQQQPSRSSGCPEASNAAAAEPEVAPVPETGGALGSQTGQLAGQRVIELGCGHALPGLVALLAGAEVHFQDYNREVLQAVSIPNVAANWDAWQFRGSAPVPMAQSRPSVRSLAAGQAYPELHGATAAPGMSLSESVSGPSPSPPARYFSGDWRALADALEGWGLAGGYDVALSAETIYSLDSMCSLYKCIKRCLKRPGGVAYVAAKSYYFGVGGGTAAFVRLVEGEGEMQAKVVRLLDDGLSNKREIIALSWRS